jgi:hypothetical protein
MFAILRFCPDKNDGDGRISQVIIANRRSYLFVGQGVGDFTRVD